MKSGLLFYDNSPAPLADKILAAIKRYQEKFGTLPNRVFVNPQDLAVSGVELLSAETGILVDVKMTILKNHIWLGVELQATDNANTPAFGPQDAPHDARIANHPNNPNWRGVAHWFNEAAGLTTEAAQ